MIDQILCVNTASLGILGKLEAKGRVSTNNTHSVIRIGGERRIAENKSRDRKVMIIRFEREAITNTLKMLNIRRDGIGREVVHSFVKACMKCNFDAVSLEIIP
jgi:hypothetical protein